MLPTNRAYAPGVILPRLECGRNLVPTDVFSDHLFVTTNGRVGQTMTENSRGVRRASFDGYDWRKALLAPIPRAAGELGVGAKPRFSLLRSSPVPLSLRLPAVDAGGGEGGHVVVHVGAGPQQEQGQRCAGAFAQAQLQVEQRLLAHGFHDGGVAGFGRGVA